ncbi:hypothetical protein QP162_22105 [Sphingomonas aurantiaca]|uniref:hypothetical protein n=1 Tax=Sphingomonas aurantiaca TaxID=185949 RepID=UPI002FE30D92
MATDDARRAIGKVISVAADRFVVELHRGSDNFTVVGFDDVHYVAMLGSFVVIPSQTEYVVAEVIGLWEKDPTSGRLGGDGATTLDKAGSSKFLETRTRRHASLAHSGSFRFGVSTFPSLYADALYVLDAEARSHLRGGRLARANVAARCGRPYPLQSAVDWHLGHFQGL